MLKCKNWDFYYGSSQRLKDVTIEISNGAIIGLFGHNGSGKTTLLKMLGGILPIRFGEYLLFDKSATDTYGYLRRDLRRYFGVLFQGTSSDEKLSVYHNLIYGAKLMGISNDKLEAVVNETLKLADLKDRAFAPAKKLSHGMRRRLELYRTFMHRPQIILLDEPTASLDVMESQKFFSFLKQYQKNTKALVIMSTHRPEEMMETNRVILMKNGMIIGDLPPKELIADLNYVRCSFTLHDGKARDVHPALFDVEFDSLENNIRAKLPLQDLDAFWQSRILRDRSVKAFSMEDPTIADVYEDLCRTSPSC